MIADTKKFGLDSIKFVFLHGVCIGIGEIVFGLLSARFGRFVQANRIRIYTLSFLLNLITFLLILLNHPNDSPFQESNDFAFIKPV